MEGGLLWILWIVVIAIVAYFAWQWWLKNKAQPAPVKTFSLNYNEVGQPAVEFINGAPVEPSIDPQDVLYFHNNVISPMDGDVLQLELTASGTVIARHVLQLNTYTGQGDWSLLENLCHQLQVDGYMTNKYSLGLYRNDVRIINNLLGSSVARIEWFDKDFRSDKGSLMPLVFVLGDFVLVADPTTMVANYIYYCIRDDAGVFRLHDLSPKKDAPTTTTWRELRQRYKDQFIGLTNSRLQEVAKFEPESSNGGDGGGVTPDEPIKINTSESYKGSFTKFPTASDPNLITIQPVDGLKDGDTILINQATEKEAATLNRFYLRLPRFYAATAGQTLYTLGPVSLESSNGVLTNDTKYLLTGVYQLLVDENLLGKSLIQIQRGGQIVAEQDIPANATGLKFLNDPRWTDDSVKQDVVISDILDAQGRDASGTISHDYLWCIDVPNQRFTDGKDFSGTLAEYNAQYKGTHPTIVSAVANFSNAWDPTVIRTEPLDANSASGGGDSGTGGDTGTGGDSGNGTGGDSGTGTGGDGGDSGTGTGGDSTTGGDSGTGTGEADSGTGDSGTGTDTGTGGGGDSGEAALLTPLKKKMRVRGQ